MIEYQGKWDDGYDDKAEDIWNTIGHDIEDIVFQPPPKDITFKDGMLHVPENKLAPKKRPASFFLFGRPRASCRLRWSLSCLSASSSSCGSVDCK